MLSFFRRLNVLMSTYPDVVRALALLSPIISSHEKRISALEKDKIDEK